MATTKSSRARFGNVRKLAFARWRARYTGPDARTHKAHVTFDAKGDAEHWLATVREGWIPPTAAAAPQMRALPFGDYSTTWLKGRKARGRPLPDRTREHHQSLLDRFPLPTFSEVPLRYITRELVDKWYELRRFDVDAKRGMIRIPRGVVGNRPGHRTPGATMRYQRAAQERDVGIAHRLSALVEVPHA